MTNDNAEPEAIPLDLPGRGPFELPICSDVDIAVGELLAVLTFTTIEGRRVRVPVGRPVVRDLRRLATQALNVMAGHPE